MIRTKNILSILVTVFTLTACHTDNDDANNNTNNNANRIEGVSTIGNKTIPHEVTQLEFPRIKGGNSMIVVHHATLNDHTGEKGMNYAIEWDTDKKAQRWSCYKMYQNIAQQYNKRYTDSKNQYPLDDIIPQQFQFDKDPYWRTGYDHGHICPSGDRRASKEADKQTFFLSNMQPQLHGFNDGVWKHMEQQLRNWTNINFCDTLYICKGGTIDNENQIKTKLHGFLIVPQYFFMAVLCKNKYGYKAMGFWVEHSDNKDKDLTKYMVSIKDLERLTGIDFFCNLPDNIEQRVETMPIDLIKTAWPIHR